MAFIEGSRGIYGPIKVMIDRPIYERALEICWHILSYKNYIAVLTELLRLQQEDRIPSELTVEDMTDQFLEESKKSLRMRRWDFEREGFSDDFQPFLKMVMDVLTSMKMRDVQFEARWLFEYPEDIPPCFQNPKIMKLAQKFGESLTEQLQATPRSRLLGPSEVVVEVVPKVLQGFWLPSPTTYLNMPSQELSDMAVGVTKAVMDRVTRALSSGLHRVIVSRPIRDAVVLSVQERVRQMYPEDILRQRLDCFAAQLLDEIAEAATRDICALFQPQADTDTPSIPDRDDTVQRPTKELDSPVAAAPSHHVTSADEPVSQVEAEQPATNSSTSSAENSTPAITWIVEEPTRNTDSPVAPALPPTVSPGSGLTVQRFGLTITLALSGKEGLTVSHVAVEQLAPNSVTSSGEALEIASAQEGKEISHNEHKKKKSKGIQRFFGRFRKKRRDVG